MRKGPLIQCSVALPPLQDSVLRYYAWLHRQNRTRAMRQLLTEFGREYFNPMGFHEFVETVLLPGDEVNPELQKERARQVHVFLRGCGK